MGVHRLQPRPQRLPPMARLRPPNAFAEMGLEWYSYAGWTRRGHTGGSLLDPPILDVLSELRARGLGN
jgi:hypothetical protein